jgi:hypothetical protein
VFDIQPEVWENVCRWEVVFQRKQRKAHSMNTITAWTHDDLLTDLKAEVLEVRKEYGVPSLNHIPDFELVSLAYAQLGDLVHIGKGRIGIVYDIAEARNARELRIVSDNFRVVMKRISL